MLRFLNVFLFCLLSGVFVACSAPSTASTAQKPIDIPPAPDPGYTPPAGLPDNIEDILQSSNSFWTGKTQTGEFFYFRKENNSLGNNALFRIQILKPASIGNQAVSTDYYTLKEFNNAPLGNGVWVGYFYLKGDDGKLDINTKMECRMKFITLTEAEVTFSPKGASDKLKDYGTFKATAQ